MKVDAVLNQNCRRRKLVFNNEKNIKDFCLRIVCGLRGFFDLCKFSQHLESVVSAGYFTTKM